MLRCAAASVVCSASHAKFSAPIVPAPRLKLTRRVVDPGDPLLVVVERDRLAPGLQVEHAGGV